VGHCPTNVYHCRTAPETPKRQDPPVAGANLAKSRPYLNDDPPITSLSADNADIFGIIDAE
ncbi:MAG: hypothetical protein ABL959_23870, partial [Pyrinomonadaceae bacterium]